MLIGNLYRALLGKADELCSKDITANDVKEENALIADIEQENEQLLSKRNRELYSYKKDTKLTQAEEKMERIKKLQRQEESKYKQFINEANKDSWVDFIANFSLIIVRAFLPFKDNLKYIFYHFNSTILALFEIIRFFFVISTFGIIIFLFLIIYHFIVSKSALANSAKYGIPSIFLYSSYQEKEGQAFSITYGVWQIMFFFGFVMFYYVTRSEIYKNEAYVHSSKYSVLSNYLFTSWDFNVNSKNKAQANKEEIDKLTNEYLTDYKDKLRNKGACCRCNCSHGFGRVISYLIFVAIMVVMFFIIMVFFKARDFVKSDLTVADKVPGKNLFADLFPLLLNALVAVVFPYVFELLTLMERQKPWGKMYSNSLKKVIFACVFVFSIIIEQVKVVLKQEEFLKHMNLDKGASSFDCHGQYIGFLNTTGEALFTNRKPMKQNGFSVAREDEVGLNFLFLALFYFGTYYVKEIILVIGYSCCKRCGTRRFQPFEVLIHVFTEFVLFSVVVFFMPFFILLFPFIFFIDFKYHFAVLKNQANFKYDVITVSHRNNAHDILSWFFTLGLLSVVVTLYFYLTGFRKIGCSVCVATDTFSMREFTNQTVMMTMQNDTALESLMTSGIAENPFVGLFHKIFSSSVVIFMFLFSFLAMSLYKNYEPDDEYYEEVIRKEKKLVDQIEVINEHLVRRDIISTVLLKLVNDKEQKKKKK